MLVTLFIGTFGGGLIGWFTRDWIQALRDRDRYRELVASRLQDRERTPRDY